MIALATHAMGTRFEFALCGEDAARLRSAGEEAIREVELWHDRLSRFQPDSEVSRLNRERGGRVDPELFELLALCAGVSAASDGAFDPCVGELMERWGLHPRAPRHGYVARSTAEPERGIVLDSATRRVWLRGSSMLDLGAVAKGFALDRAAAMLREQGVTRALLHGGTSSVIAIGGGSFDGAEGWAADVRSEGKLLRVCLGDEAMGVSAPRGRAVGTDHDSDIRITHIVDPRSGRPATDVDTAVVIGPSAAECDAWSTALIVLGARPDQMDACFQTHIHRTPHGWNSSRARLAETA